MTVTAFFDPAQPAKSMRSIIQRVATGPELSQNLSLAEARFAMSAILAGEVDEVQAAVFLIALRMKRETDDENKGIMEAIRARTDRAVAPVPDVVDLADPYDGYNRTLTPTAFLPAVLAAAGVPAFSHGVRAVGPKYGATHATVLAAAGMATNLDSATAAHRLGDVGWAYVDQSRFCQPLHDLIEFRTRIVKRPAVTTVEVMAGPIVGRERTHLVTGYVHKPYPRIYALLARHAGYRSAVMMRGTEGGVIASLRQPGRLFRYADGGEVLGHDLNPADLGIRQTVRALPFKDERENGEKDIAALSALSAELGLAALAGEAGAMRDGLVYAGACVLWHLGRVESLAAGAGQIRAVLDSGAAKARFEAAQ